MNRYYIAIVPPQDIQDYANRVMQDFADNYASCGAQKSPPHITLQSPFEWANENITFLEEYLTNFAFTQKPVPIRLNGFGAFAPRVIYINVEKNRELLALQSDLTLYIEEKFQIIDANSKNRPFVPHMTVAYRDLTKQNFKTAWLKYENQQVYFEFVAGSLTLLQHDSKRWNIQTQFKLGE